MARLSKTLRFEVLARDGFKCRYCGVGADAASLHVDHVKPIARGGTDRPDNLVAACADCNHGKSDRELIPTRGGFDLTADKRPGRMAKMRYAAKSAALPQIHQLDTSEIDDLDEIDEDEQLSLVWCETHGKYEWHWIDRDLIGSGAVVRKSAKPVFS